MLPSHSHLSNLNPYLSRYPHNHPAAFEYLVASTFSKISYLPFQSQDNRDDNIKNRVIWFGSVRDLKTTTRATSPSGADSICFAYGYTTLIECTLRTGGNQWRMEFIESLRHYDNFIGQTHIDRKDIYLILIVPSLHNDTYTGFRQKACEGYNIICLDSINLAKICETCKFISTIKHLDLRLLFNHLLNEFRYSTSFCNYKIDLDKTITEWEKNILKSEKTVYFGLKSYEAIRKTGRTTVGTSDILMNLHKDSKFNHYLKILGGGDLTSHIKEGLLSEKLANLITTPEEDFFCRVKRADFKARGLRLIEAVERINV